MENRFKVLMYAGNFVDTKILNQGIYTSNFPDMYKLDETLESLEEKAKRMVNSTGNFYFSERFFENLSKCELVIYKLIKVDES